MAERGRGSRRVVGRHLLLPWAAPSRAAESLRRSALSHTSAPTRREVPAGVMSRRWLSTRCVSGFARREAAREGERAGAPVVGHRALRLQQAGGWRGKGGQRRRGQVSDGRTRKPQKRTRKPQKITPKPQKCTPKPHFANLQKKT